MGRRYGQLSQEDWESRVLDTFMPRGHLVQVPAQRKKRLVILRWLADLFRPAERYPEPVVNDVLRRYHDDVATLRRLMVDEELFQRRAGLYWRAGTLPYPPLRRPSTAIGD